ncbi:hypothetical protein F1880_004641 [Penicillium rolfsii]|nr:hypothetical protein F1880_004641 [Penicillium rolfsii]
MISDEAHHTDSPFEPADYGKLIQASDGGYFRLQCCTHQPSGVAGVGSQDNVASYKDCLDLCLSDANPECDRVLFAHTLAVLLASSAHSSCAPSVTYDIHKSCGFYKKGGFSTVPCGNTEHDWLYYIDPPTQPAANDQIVSCSTECPTAHGQKYVSDFGEVRFLQQERKIIGAYGDDSQLFHMECGKRHGTVPFRQEYQATYRDCIDACANVPKCSSVDYSNRTLTCYYGTHSGAPAVEAPGYFSAYSLGCAGACEKGDDGCECGGSKKCRGRGAGDASHGEL